MEQPAPTSEHLTDFERAVCYYSLPMAISPMTTGIVLVYALILLEAVGSLTYGLVAHHETYTLAGAWSFGGMIVFGLVVFTLRSLFSEVRRRRALALARVMPEPGQVDGSLPDPFAEHLLLRVPERRADGTFTCADNAGRPQYTVEGDASRAWLKVKNAEGHEHLRINIRKSASSFSFLEYESPSWAEVFMGTELVGSFRRRFSMTATVTAVNSVWPVERRYVLRGDGFYRDRRLVGRLYRVRRHIYLDIRRNEYCDTILALFLVQTS